MRWYANEHPSQILLRGGVAALVCAAIAILLQASISGWLVAVVCPVVLTAFGLVQYVVSRKQVSRPPQE